KNTEATRYSITTRFMLIGIAPLLAGCAAVQPALGRDAGAVLPPFAGDFFLNISSIRRVTRKPPKTLTAASATASTPIVLPGPDSRSAAASVAPTTMLAEMALVTAIRGVGSAGVAFDTTW